MALRRVTPKVLPRAKSIKIKKIESLLHHPSFIMLLRMICLTVSLTSAGQDIRCHPSYDAVNPFLYIKYTVRYLPNAVIRSQFLER